MIVLKLVEEANWNRDKGAFNSRGTPRFHVPLSVSIFAKEMDFFTKRTKPASSVQTAPPKKRPTPVLGSILISNTAYTPSYSLPFIDLCACLDQIEATTKRLQIIDILTEFFTGIMQHSDMSETDKVGDLIRTAYLCLSRVYLVFLCLMLHLFSWDQIMRESNWGSGTNS